MKPGIYLMQRPLKRDRRRKLSYICMQMPWQFDIHLNDFNKIYAFLKKYRSIMMSYHNLMIPC